MSQASQTNRPLPARWIFGIFFAIVTFLRRYVFSTDHKTIGLQFLFSTLVWLAIGGFLALAIVPFVLIPVQSVLLSWANPAGQRSLTVSLSTAMLGFALAAGLLIVIGWAMRDASDVAAENRAFV